MIKMKMLSLGNEGLERKKTQKMHEKSRKKSNHVKNREE